MTLRQPVKQGLSAPSVTSIPSAWDAEWFRRFITNYLQPGDLRNSVSGAGISITSGAAGVSQPGTVSLNSAAINLFGEPYLLAVAPTDASLTGYRVAEGQIGVISLTDTGPTGTMTVGVITNSIGPTQIRQSGPQSVVGNPTNAAANVADISATADGQVLQRAGGVLTFAQVPLAAIVSIPNNTVLGNVSGSPASPATLTAAQLATLVGTVTGGNPTTKVGLTVVNGTAGTFMRSDAAPPLDVTISPTWTGHHVISPSTSGVALILNGVSAANVFTQQIIAGSTAAQSNGLLIQAGVSNSQDRVLDLFNQAGTVRLFGVFGDGSVVTGGQSLLGSGIINAAGLAIAGNPVYAGRPQNQQGTYTLVLSDANKMMMNSGTGQTQTIPSNASVPYPIGTEIEFVSFPGVGNLLIAINTDTMTLSPAGTTGTRTLAASGVALARKITATQWIISGTGLT